MNAKENSNLGNNEAETTSKELPIDVTEQKKEESKPDESEETKPDESEGTKSDENGETKPDEIVDENLNKKKDEPIDKKGQKTCKYCGEPCDSEQEFCSEECREIYKKTMKQLHQIV